MIIKRIHVTNFRSFRDIKINLSKFNVLIGQNASGKSNFVQIFKFLSDISKHGVENAISMQGGVKLLRNVSLGASENLSIEVELENKPDEGETDVQQEKGGISITHYDITSRFSLKFHKKGSGFKIIEDRMMFRIYMKIIREEQVETWIGEVTFEIVKGKFGFSSKVYPEGFEVEYLKALEEEYPDDLADKFPGYTDIIDYFYEDVYTFPQGSSFRLALPQNSTLLESHFLMVLLNLPDIQEIERFFGMLPIYDFDPKLPKKAVPITGRVELENDASNLASVLQNILRVGNKRRMFSNLIRDVLHFVKEIKVQRVVDRSLYFEIQELYSPETFLPASLLSDGTVNITALILALFFEKQLFAIIEEPARCIHPFLVSRIVKLMYDASENKQILITTHNPEIIRYIELEDLLTVSRDKEYFSTIARPIDKEKIRQFLENELGVVELYIKDLLG